MKAWQTTVLDFSSSVKGFYDESLAKLPGPEDAAGYQRMRLEWERRVQSSRGRVQ
jgi:hypothetical protein